MLQKRVQNYAILMEYPKENAKKCIFVWNG